METFGRCIIFSAPSGSGKSTIVNWLMTAHPELELVFSVSATSRPPRGAEKHGTDYYFLSLEDFRKHIAHDDFLEYEEVYKDRFYGTLKSEADRLLAEGKRVVFDVDVMGGRRIKQYFGQHALSIFIQPPSIEELRRRLTTRATEDMEQITQRIARAEFEIAQAVEFDQIVINDNLELAEQQTLALIKDFLSQ